MSLGSFLDPDLGKLLVVPTSDQYYLVVLGSTLRCNLDTFVELVAFHNDRLVPSCVRPCCNRIELGVTLATRCLEVLAVVLLEVICPSHWFIGFRRMRRRIVDNDLLRIDHIVRYN
jgi:hypothetical protein